MLVNMSTGNPSNHEDGLVTAPKSSLKTAPKSLADYGFTPLSSALANTPSQMNSAASITPSPTGLEEQFQPLQFGSRVPGSSSVRPHPQRKCQWEFKVCDEMRDKTFAMVGTTNEGAECVICGTPKGMSHAAAVLQQDQLERDNPFAPHAKSGKPAAATKTASGAHCPSIWDVASTATAKTGKCARQSETDDEWCNYDTESSED